RHHPVLDLEDLRLQHADLRGRAAEHSRGAVRGRAHRRGRRLGALPARHRAQSGAHLPAGGRDHDDLAVPALRRALRDDAGRSTAEYREPHPPHVRAGLPLVAARVRRGDRLHPADPGADRNVDSAAGPARGARMTRRRSSWLANGALALIAVVTLFPLLWMVSASFMPAGAANTMPPPLWPRHPTLEHYAALFTRLDFPRNFVNSLLISTVTTVLSLF